MEARELIGALSALSCPVAIAIFGIVCLSSDLLRIRRLAYRGAAVTAPLAVASLVASGETWSRACAVVTLLVIAQAAAIVFAGPGRLADYLDDQDPSGDPPWWPAFEREFRTYSQRVR